MNRPRRKKPSRYPEYPGSNWDYAVRESARQALRNTKNVICLYCHREALTEETINHEPDCPAKGAST